MPFAADHVADQNGVELVRLAKLYEFPDFVKKADFDKAMKPRDVATTVYADPVRKQFPCHNAASTWLSNLYYREKRAEFHPKDQARIEQRLNHYVDYWRIRGDVDKMLAKHAEYYNAIEASLPDSSYAWVWTDEQSGHKERRLPLRNATEVKMAADWLQQYRDQVPFQTRHTMAVKVLAKAARFGAAIGSNIEFLEKQAGRGVCDPDVVISMIKDRAKLTDSLSLKQEVLKLAHTVQDSPRRALQPDMLVKLAEVIDTLDRKIGIVGKYTASIPRPEDVIFSATFSKAAADLVEHCATTSGQVYKKADFKKLALDDVRSLFGDAFADEVRSGLDGVDSEKMAELVATLPVPDAELFGRLMEDNGLRPQLTKAASAKRGFSDADFAELAAAY